MRHVTRSRAAILTSAGLLPLACFAERAVDSVDAAAPGAELEPTSSSAEPSDVVSRVPSVDGKAEPARAALPSCGRDAPVPAEELGRGISRSSPVRTAGIETGSIAAFARFTLQLLHLGAPCELIEASQRAMLDETRHA